MLQAVQAFEKMIELFPDDPKALAHAYLNLARAYERNGELLQAEHMLEKIRTGGLPAPWWTVAWFTGLINAQNGHLDRAVANFREILAPEKQERARHFDFSRDDVVRNELALTLFRLAQQESDDVTARDHWLKEAVTEFERHAAPGSRKPGRPRRVAQMLRASG